MGEKMTTRQARAIETRKKIVLAAKKLISAKGFDSISIEEIAKEAGVSTGSFYTYFKKKEDVVEELGKTDFYRLAEIANEMKQPLLERLKYYCREFLGDIEKTGIEICRQWLRNNVAPESMCFGDEEMTKYKYDVRAMRSLLQDALNRGELSEETPIDDLTLFINAELYGLMIAWCMSDGEVKGSKKTDLLCDTVINAALSPYRK